MKRFEKRFSSFEEGIKELCQVSFSAEDALSHSIRRIPKTEEEAATALAINVLHDRPTGNGANWSDCNIEITASGVDYVTTGGVGFGWYCAFDAVEGLGFCWDRRSYVFYVTHPTVVRGERDTAPEDSTLRKSAEAKGWKEVFERSL